MKSQNFDIKKLLIIDDDEMVLSSLKKQLKGYSIFTSKGGSEALLFLKIGELFPDLILCDIMMPEIDGFQFVKILRENSDYFHIPVMFITGFPEDERRIKSLELGAIDYLIKPFRKEEILLKVRNILEYQDRFKEHLDNKSNRRKIESKFLEYDMTLQESEIIKLILNENLIYKEIAYKMKISLRTVESHISHIYKKMNINSKKELIKIFE
ncbi:MAG TPA: response regulator transcription factor [Spirochaetota bacterium]|nr:response regulator transcription factor [Spirochaetota bacterium]